MSNILIKNLKEGKNVIAFIVGATFLSTTVIKSHLVNNEVFGQDGNGGHMLKIVTDLTDEEIAKLKFTKRLHWHLPTTHKFSEGKDLITDQELSDRGIEIPQEKYIEYNKRPPHDKFL